MTSKKVSKKFNYDWVFECFGRDASFYTKRMFGGLSAYFNGLMVIVLVESPGEREYRGKNYDFDIWDGVLFPTFREFHESLTQEFEGLIQHPVLGKWLYLPATYEDFEEQANQLAERILASDPRLGIEPKIKKQKKK